MSESYPDRDFCYAWRWMASQLSDSQADLLIISYVLHHEVNERLRPTDQNRVRVAHSLARRGLLTQISVGPKYQITKAGGVVALAVARRRARQ